MLVSDADWDAAVGMELADSSTHPAREHRVFIEDRMRAMRAVQTSGHGAWFGAFEEGRILCGLGLFTDGSGLARFQSVGTVKAARGQGLTRALVHHASRVAVEDWDVETLVMVADPAYHAIRIYRSLGFADRETQLAISRPGD